MTRDISRIKVQNCGMAAQPSLRRSRLHWDLGTVPTAPEAATMKEECAQ